MCMFVENKRPSIISWAIKLEVSHNISLVIKLRPHLLLVSVNTLSDCLVTGNKME